MADIRRDLTRTTLAILCLLPLKKTKRESRRKKTATRNLLPTM